MMIKVRRICMLVCLLIVIAAAVWIGYHYYHTSKQVYEGILVYQEQSLDGINCCQA